MGITNVLGALYASVIFLGIINSIVLQPIAAENRGVLYRERAAGNPSHPKKSSCALLGIFCSNFLPVCRGDFLDLSMGILESRGILSLTDLAGMYAVFPWIAAMVSLPNSAETL